MAASQPFALLAKLFLGLFIASAPGHLPAQPHTTLKDDVIYANTIRIEVPETPGELGLIYSREQFAQDEYQRHVILHLDVMYKGVLLRSQKVQAVLSRCEGLGLCAFIAEGRVAQEFSYRAHSFRGKKLSSLFGTFTGVKAAVGFGATIGGRIFRNDGGVILTAGLLNRGIAIEPISLGWINFQFRDRLHLLDKTIRVPSHEDLVAMGASSVDQRLRAEKEQRQEQHQRDRQDRLFIPVTEEQAMTYMEANFSDRTKIWYTLKNIEKADLPLSPTFFSKLIRRTTQTNDPVVVEAALTYFFRLHGVLGDRFRSMVYYLESEYEQPGSRWQNSRIRDVAQKILARHQITDKEASELVHWLNLSPPYEGALDTNIRIVEILLNNSNATPLNASEFSYLLLSLHGSYRIGFQRSRAFYFQDLLIQLIHKEYQRSQASSSFQEVLTDNLAQSHSQLKRHEWSATEYKIARNEVLVMISLFKGAPLFPPLLAQVRKIADEFEHLEYVKGDRALRAVRSELERLSRSEALPTTCRDILSSGG